MGFNLTTAQISAFNKDGFLIIKQFLNSQEVNKLYEVAMADDVINKNSYNVNDQSGKKSKLALWFKPGNDVFGLLTKSERIVNAVDQLLDGDSSVCHFHSKLMQKEPKVGGAWEWHQDYGYWYKNEYLLPDQMISVMVAITEATKENGCLQVIKGSHKMGRVEHGFAGEQVGSSQRYVDLALKTMELIYVELQAGDVLFFHSNTLHRSEANLSEKSRWSLISAYNRQSNVPYNDVTTSSTEALEVVSDDAMLNGAVGGLMDNDSFLSKEKDISLKA